MSASCPSNGEIEPARDYIRQPHRDVLTIHGLVQRGNLSTEEPVMKFLARFGNKFVVWRILQYWRDSGAD